MIENFIDTAEDYIIDDEAEEIEDAMDDLITDNFSNDIDITADLPIDDAELEDYENEEFADDEYEDDEEDYVDYDLSDDYF